MTDPFETRLEAARIARDRDDELAAAAILIATAADVVDDDPDATPFRPAVEISGPIDVARRPKFEVTD